MAKRAAAVLLIAAAGGVALYLWSRRGVLAVDTRAVNPLDPFNLTAPWLNNAESFNMTAQPAPQPSSSGAAYAPSLWESFTGFFAVGGVPEMSYEDAYRLRGKQYEQLIRGAAARNGLDGDLLMRQCAQESQFDPLALSRRGAKGLMQFMPDTAAQYGITDPYDPVQSVNAGARYMRDILGRQKTYPLALAAYNMGERGLRLAIAGQRVLPRETIEYVRIIAGADLRQIVASIRGGAFA